MVNRRIDRVNRPRDDNVYSSRIQEDKKEKSKYSQLEDEKESKLLIATFLQYLKRMFDSFSPSKNLAGKVVNLHTIIEHLESFKKHLYELSERDLSNSSEYATKLSDDWELLIEDFDTVEILERKNLSDIAAFRSMMEEIKHYPPDSEHRLGYYLLQHAGKDWLPFPFIEMLESLHKEYIETPESGHLANWLSSIDRVIEQLKNHLPFKLS